jgi:hypothetical protein
MSLSRKFSGVALLVLMAVLILIMMRSVQDQPTLQTRVNAYQTFHTIPNTHIDGHEIQMTPLEAGQDTLQNCEKLCLEQDHCVAVNYYPVTAEQKQKAQCWLFSTIDGAKIKLNQSCCTLAIKTSQPHTLAVFEQFMTTRQHIKNKKPEDMKIFPQIHLHGHEIEMVELTDAHNDIALCTERCVANQDCVAANYYPSVIDKKQKAQCWLFSALEADKIEAHQPCCSLILDTSLLSNQPAINERLRQLGIMP